MSLKTSIKSSGLSVGKIFSEPLGPFARKADLSLPSIFSSIPDFSSLVFSGPKVVPIGRCFIQSSFIFSWVKSAPNFSKINIPIIV